MDNKREILSLSAETLAFSAIIVFVLGRIARSDPRLAEAISLGFNDAADHLEHLAIKLGKAAPSEHTVKALRIVEDIRSKTLGDPKKPGGIV